MRASGLALCLSFAAAATIFAADARPPWTLRSSERVALRLDPANLAERRRIAAQRSGGHSAAFVLSGSDHPELFLPTELMNTLLSVVTPDAERTALRQKYEQSMRPFGWDPPTFWTELKTSGREYFNAIDHTSGERDAVTSRRLCAGRAATLERMRAKYERFDEFLYVAIAPDITLVSADVPSAEWSLWIDGGCKRGN